MRYGCLVWLIAGCGFASPASTAEDPGGDPGGGSAGPGAGPGGAGTSGKCDVSDPSLRLCVSFGVNPMVQDLVTPPHNVVPGSASVGALTNIALPFGGLVASTVGTFDERSQLRFQESSDFDVMSLTIDFWMLPQDTATPDNPYFILDNNTEYSASYDGSAVRCAVAGTTAVSRSIMTPGSWHHVACTYGTTDRQLRVYVDGDLSGCKMASPIPRGGIDGVAIGANYDGKNGFQQNFVGNLGNLHLFATELAPDQICRAAGRTSGCNPACPAGGGGSGGNGADPGGSP
jgi:hypothetical protein